MGYPYQMVGSYVCMVLNLPKCHGLPVSRWKSRNFCLALELQLSVKVGLACRQSHSPCVVKKELGFASWASARSACSCSCGKWWKSCSQSLLFSSLFSSQSCLGVFCASVAAGWERTATIRHRAVLKQEQACLPAPQSPSAQGALPLLQAAVVTFRPRLPWISKHLLCWMCLGSLNQVSFQAPDCPPDSAVSFQRKRRYFRHAVSNRCACCLSNRAAWR